MQSDLFGIMLDEAVVVAKLRRAVYFYSFEIVPRWPGFCFYPKEAAVFGKHNSIQIFRFCARLGARYCNQTYRETAAQF